jgi:predicted permease
MRELPRRIAYLWNRRRLEREMAEEMAYHRELMPPERRAAFGNELRLREDAREIWGWTWLDRLHQDLAYGARVLRNSPGFSLTAMLVLGLGIGVPLTAFRAVMAGLEGGTAPDPDTLVRVTRRAPGVSISQLPYPALVFYAANTKSFRQVIGLSAGNSAVFGEEVEGRAPEHIQLNFATSNYYSEFGITPAAGRLLTASDERPDAEPAALVGEPFWRRLGGSPAIIGQDIRVNGKLLRVVGVVPRSSGSGADVWLPLVHQPYVIQGSTFLTDWNSGLNVYARLRAGVSPEAAREETLAAAARLRELRPEDVHPGEYLDLRPINKLDISGKDLQRALAAAALVMLVLAVACANLGTLVMARGVTREREIQVRMALGASRGRVVRQLFTESLMLAGLSAVCGLLLSTAVLKAIQWRHNLDSGILPDWRVLGATFGAGLLAALIFGLPPALRLTSLAPRPGRTRPVFLAVQVAASCVLLVVSSFLGRGVQRLGSMDPGFDFRHLVLVSPGLKEHGYNGPAAQAYLDQLQARAVELPGVRAASRIWLAPWGDRQMGAVWRGRQFSGNHVDAQFVNTMGMRLLRGRNFQPGEKGVALISEAMERVVWPDRDALGKSLPWAAHGPAVIGVVRNASTAVVGSPGPLEFYLPLAPGEAPESLLLVRVSGRPQDSVRGLRDAARSLDGRLRPAVWAVTDAYDKEVENVSRAMFVLAILGAVAMLLCAIGLAGLAGYSVAQRTREIGLRVALGARPGQVVGAIVCPMVRPIAIGFVCGALGGAAVAGVLRSGLPAMAGLEVLDPLAYFISMAFLGAAVLLSLLAPGRRALRINPSQALQHE